MLPAVWEQYHRLISRFNVDLNIFIIALIFFYNSVNTSSLKNVILL